MLIAKAGIHMAMPVDGKPNSGKLFFATIDRRRFAATVSLPTALVKGTIQAKVAKEPRSFLTIDAGPFFPVTGAKVFHCAAAESLECPVVIVNKSQVATLAFATLTWDYSRSPSRGAVSRGECDEKDGVAAQHIGECVSKDVAFSDEAGVRPTASQQIARE